MIASSKKACSHSTICTAYDSILYILFCEIVHTEQWGWMLFAMYLYWNHTLQSHRMGMEPIHV